MKKILTGVLTGLFLFMITRTLTYLLGLDAIARRLAQEILLVPAGDLHLVVWLASGFVGLIGLALWLISSVDERLSNIASPRPAIGSLPVASDPAFKLEINRTRERTLPNCSSI